MFNAMLVIHIIAGSVCLVSGFMAKVTRKKRNSKHPIFETAYHWFYVVVFLTAVIMAIAHWADSYYLFYIGIFSYAFALLGYLAVRIKWRNWIASHLAGMLGSYIAIITAVLVTNGDHIPLIDDLPHYAIWTMPTIIGTPLIFLVGNKYNSRRINRHI